MGKSWKQWLPLQIPLNNVYISVFLSQWFKLLFISAVILQPGECESTTLGHKISHKISQGEMILLDLLFLTKKNIIYNIQVKFQTKKFPDDYEN